MSESIQLSLDLQELVPLNWKPADGNQKSFWLEQIIKHACECGDVKAATTAIREHNLIHGHHAAKKVDVEDNRQAARTREEMEESLRAKGIDPATIIGQVLK